MNTILKLTNLSSCSFKITQRDSLVFGSIFILTEANFYCLQNSELNLSLYANQVQILNAK